MRTGGDLVFAYLNDTYSKPEKLLLTLYQVGAMTQSDLTTVLGWSEKRTSKVITTLNGGRNKNRKNGSDKISGTREYLGKRNSGKIRYLSRTGLEYAASLTGQYATFLPLKDGEARILANLSKFAIEYSKSNPSVIYYGPFLAKIKFPLNDLRSESPVCLKTGDSVWWLLWINEAMAAATIRNRLDEWRYIQSRVSKMDSAHSHQVITVCSTTDVARRVSDQAYRVKSFPLHVTMLGKSNEVFNE